MLPGNTGDHTEKLRESKADQDEKLVNTVEERMANLNELTSGQGPDDSDNLDDPNSEPDDPKASSQADPDDDPDDGKDADKEDEDGSKDDGSKDDKTDIPYAYEQAALRSGWTKEDIDAAVKENPERAKKMFSLLHNSIVQSSREFSALGRVKKDLDTPKPASTTDTKTDDFTGVDIAKLKEEYEDNPIIEGVVVPLNDALKRLVEKVNGIAPAVSPVSNPTPVGNNAEELALQQTIENFFNSDQMKPYEKVYGRLSLGQDWSELPSGQNNYRWKVIQEADAIVAGYRAIGQTIEPDEALARAHLLITEPIREQIIREGIKNSSTKRAKGITMKPSDGTQSSSTADKFGTDSKPRNRQELEVKVGEKLKNMSW